VVSSIASVSSPDRLDFYDGELRAHHEHLRAAYGIGAGDEVVDIGCGTGLTTREAARAAAPGRVLGVDVSERMLERARQLTAAERLDNVRYELGDAQVHRFDRAGFDVAISRFGTMFFSDPAAAFANIAAALRPEARLMMLVWQRHEHNEWARAIDAALGDAAKPPPPGADPFSLSDAGATARVLEGAGFDGIRFEDVHEPVLYGHDLDAALAFVRGFQGTSAALANLSGGEAARTVERLREMLAAHHSDDRGVVLDSRSWLITARRRCSDMTTRAKGRAWPASAHVTRSALGPQSREDDSEAPASIWAPNAFWCPNPTTSPVIHDHPTLAAVAGRGTHSA
jgi:SAM-dependent methyltransferase